MCGPTSTAGALAAPVPMKDGEITSFDLVAYHEATKAHTTSAEKEEFLTQLLSTPGGRALIADHMTAKLVPAVVAYQHKLDSVKATVACALFWEKVTVEFGGAGGLSTGHVQQGGLFSAGGGVYWGSMWFDNADDINNAESVMVTQPTSVSLTVTFFRPNGHAVGVYSGGGVSTCAGMGGGSWTIGA